MVETSSTVGAMFWRIHRFPRYRLISLPTPLERAERLGRELGLELYVKRDDVMELALGGNKARKLEFILGDALAKGCDTLITRGAYHSNHARLTAAAARKAGLEVHLVLTPPGSPEPQGNVLLDKLLGAEIHYTDTYDEADKLMERIAEELKARGRKPYIIPGGGASPHGVLGYAAAALEILQQLSEAGVRPGYIVHAAGTGATQAGLILGLRLLGADVEVVGISVGRGSGEMRERIVGLVRSAARLLGVKLDLDPEEVVVFDDYRFGGYAIITREVVETMKMAARTEALILDPVYTAKAMYGLADLASKGYFEARPVVFLHTGGTPIPFQTAEQIAPLLAEG